jgi:formamidopyrimidine-DNA glycosylase
MFMEPSTIEMPELPDIYVLAESMNKGLRGRTIGKVVVNQPKCLNVSPRRFKSNLSGRTIQSSVQHGKWVISGLNEAWSIAFNLGMGGEIRLLDTTEEPDPKRYRVVIILDRGDWIGIHHWWFGHVHLIPKGDYSRHPQLSRIGPEPLSEGFTSERLASMLSGKRGRIKSCLLDQSFIAGIGNVYVQDILWHARVHPARIAGSLQESEVEKLYWAIRRVLNEGIKYGGGPGEQDLYGNKGTYMEHRPVGYRTGEKCPECQSTIEEIRVGTTTSYICPKCQV